MTLEQVVALLAVAVVLLGLGSLLHLVEFDDMVRDHKRKGAK